MHILLTGFEPFGNIDTNVSQQVVARLAQQEWETITLSTAVLPVDQTTGPDTLIRTYIKTKPDAVLSLGQAEGRAVLSLERVAVNLLDFTIPDNAGNVTQDRQIQADGPAAYFATLPLRAMADAITAAGIPCELSLSAGAYLCNQVFYEMSHYVQRHNLSTPVGFLHLPLSPQQAAGKRPLRPSMSLDTICQGVTAALHAIAAR